LSPLQNSERHSWLLNSASTGDVRNAEGWAQIVGLREVGENHHMRLKSTYCLVEGAELLP